MVVNEQQDHTVILSIVHYHIPLNKICSNTLVNGTECLKWIFCGRGGNSKS